jgi:hypothetical protein
MAGVALRLLIAYSSRIGLPARLFFLTRPQLLIRLYPLL